MSSEENKIFKSGILDFEVNVTQKNNKGPTIIFSTQDVGGTSRLVFNITKDNQPLPLSSDVTAQLIMVMADSSRYIVNPEITDRLNGKIVYSLTDEQLMHAGNVQCELYIKYTGQTMQIHKFEFSIDKALIDSDITAIVSYYIETWNEWEAYFKVQMTVLNDALKVLKTEASSIQEQFDNLNPENIPSKNDVAAVESDLNTHKNDADIHVTTTEKDSWDAKESPASSQEKADKALKDAKDYTDTYFSEYVAFEGAVYLLEAQTYTWDISKLRTGVYIEVSRYNPGTGVYDYGFDEIFFSKSFIETHVGKAVWRSMPGSTDNARKEFKFTTTSVTGYAANSIAPNNNYAVRKIRVV
ncbi:phage baseplate upper protein [Listeria innocua]|uniref:phage baseplate upper protein n=1 Tax=Listeria innocua TaxID=1642 RepID=UPI001626E1E4|nr:phage baseplate upper protein [Listeria innocua]MBC2132072.1 phage baseplate upper protein [Listeria innocua]